MGMIALVCAVVLICIIPREIWAALLYVGLVLLVGFVGFWAFIFWALGASGA